MAVYKLFPTKDATIYSDYAYLNSGIDEILDISKQLSKVYDGQSEMRRILMQFDQTPINQIKNNYSPTPVTCSLHLYAANVSGLPSDIVLNINPISQSWDMGTGRLADIPIVDNGVAWRYRSSDQTNAWATTFNSGVTGSYTGSNYGGGTWYTSSVSQSFNFYTSKDINVDVTSLVDMWYNEEIENNGFIIQLSGSTNEVTSTGSLYTMNFFSRDTNTIYPPYLELKWDDSTWNTGSLVTITDDNVLVTLGNNKEEYRETEYAKIRVYTRKRYPTRTFTTASLYAYNNSLPQTSYYSVIDLDTNETIIDFDSTATKLSSDSTSNYFNLYMNGLEPDRYYKILIKTIIGANVYVFDQPSFYFKVTQNVKSVGDTTFTNAAGFTTSFSLAFGS